MRKLTPGLKVKNARKPAGKLKKKLVNKPKSNDLLMRLLQRPLKTAKNQQNEMMKIHVTNYSK